MATTLLIVDDEPTIHAMLKDLLAKDPFRLVHAFSGEEAQQMLRSGHIDLMFTDIMMPGMSGLELVEWTISHYPSTLCIMTTGVTDRELIKSALRLGVFDYIDKPYRAYDLRHTLLAAAEHFEAQMSALEEFVSTEEEIRSREAFLQQAEDTILERLHDLDEERAEIDQLREGMS